jgi:hypothetical protein
MQIATQIEMLHVDMLPRYVSRADCFTYMFYADMLHRCMLHEYDTQIQVLYVYY